MEEQREGENDAARVRRRRDPPHPVTHHPVTHPRRPDCPRTSPKHRRAASHAPRLAALEEDHRGGREEDPPTASKPAARRTSSLTLHDRLGVFWRDSDDEDDFSSLAASSVASSASQSPVEALAASMHATRRACEERGRRPCACSPTLSCRIDGTWWRSRRRRSRFRRSPRGGSSRRRGHPPRDSASSPRGTTSTSSRRRVRCSGSRGPPRLCA